MRDCKWVGRVESDAVVTWPTVELGDVCEFRYGKSLAASHRDGGKYAVYGSNGKVGSHSAAITDGPTIVIGRKGSFGEVAYSAESCWPIDTTYYVDSSATKADLRWLGYRLRGLGLTKLNRAAAVPGLNRDDAYRQRLLLPPLDEQRRIAAILDLADALRTKKREVLASHAELLESVFVDMFCDPAETEPRRDCYPLGDLLIGIDSGSSPVCEARPARDQEWSVLKLGAVSYGTFNPAENKAYLGDITSMRVAEVKPGDFLLSRKNTKDLVGATAIVYDTPPRRLLPDLVFRLSLDTNRIEPEYLYALLRHPRKRSQVVALASGSASSMANISQARLRTLPIEVPALEAQRAYASRVQNLRRATALGQRELAVLDELFVSLQSRAFRGEL